MSLWSELPRKGVSETKTVTVKAKEVKICTQGPFSIPERAHTHTHTHTHTVGPAAHSSAPAPDRVYFNFIIYILRQGLIT